MEVAVCPVSMEADLSIEEDIYQKLDTDKKEIRLLTLKRSTWSSYSYLVNSSWFWLIEELHYTFVSWFNTDKSLPIECQLETVESDEAPPYIALSYVREDPSETSTIFGNGKSVQVTTNLAAALRRIRRRYWDPETLWIDAICINQKDDVEKSSQVNLMRDVYTNARGVYIWLGDEEGDFSTAMKQCRCLTITSNTFYGLPSATQQALAEQGGMNRVPEAIEPIARLIFGRMEKRWMALHNLLSRPYWTRVWILQEFVLSRDALILCGGRAMSLDLLAEATAAWPSSMHMENRISQKLTSYTGHLGTGEFSLFLDMRFD
jgi:hypothetical protein